MRGTRAAAALAMGFVAAGMAPAQAGVTVRFENVSRYDNGSLRDAARREGVIREFDRHFHRLATRYLRAGQSLRIDVLDLDLAGIRDPFRTGLSEPPILSDATPPRFRLRYSLEQKGRVIASGTETVRDPNYLWNPSARLSPDRLVYEKATLTDWFRDRFVRLKPPRG